MPPAKKKRKSEEPPAKKAKAEANTKKKAKPELKKKDVKKKAVKMSADPKEFAQVLLDTCKALMLSSKVTMNEPDEMKESYQIVKTEDFSAAKPVLDLLPKDARVPLMRLSMLYAEQFEEENGEDWAYEDSDSDSGETEEEDDDDDEQDADDAEHTRAIMDDFAEELGDEKDEYLFSDIMKIEHFFQFKALFTECEAAELIASHAEGGKLAQALEDALEACAEDDEDFEEEETDEDDDDDDDEDEIDDDEESDDGSSVPWRKTED